ncbi:hypothetical protein BDV32DRAFT_127287 [Aspergillus pseudonomiae]|nr:hypothetical protein BDV32DRAFT_127287 [Aspergillus pseudonomiae]
MWCPFFSHDEVFLRELCHPYRHSHAGIRVFIGSPAGCHDADGVLLIFLHLPITDHIPRVPWRPPYMTFPSFSQENEVH